MKQDELNSTCVRNEETDEISIPQSNLESNIQISEKYPIEDFLSYKHLIYGINVRSANSVVKRISPKTVKIGRAHV